MKRGWLIGLVAALAACGGDARERPEAAMEIESLAATSRDEAQSMSAPRLPPAQALPGADTGAVSMVIRTGSVDVVVPAIEPAVAAVQRLVAELGGHVTNVSVQGGEDRLPTAQLTVRVPADRFDAALAGLEPLGEVAGVSVSAMDVGEEYVDVQAQARNRSRLEARLLELLDARTGDLEDVLAVERELARVREQIDRLESRLRYLRQQVAMSTLTVSLREPAPFLSTPRGDNVLLHALRTAWRNFVDMIAWIIASVGLLLPLALLLWLLWLLFRWRQRRRRRDVVA